jgi:hypothetical protein
LLTWHDLQVGWTLWDMVEEQHVADILPPTFFNRDSRWFWRGKEYRALVEPVEIANWYMHNRQWLYKEQYGCEEEGYHYAQGIDTEEDEVRVDNGRRPSRFRLLQQIEKDAFQGWAASSLGLARKLQLQLGNKQWEEVLGIWLPSLLTVVGEEPKVYSLKKQPTGRQCRVFISHAAEQKKSFVDFLKDELKRICGGPKGEGVSTTPQVQDVRAAGKHVLKKSQAALEDAVVGEWLS